MIAPNGFSFRLYLPTRPQKRTVVKWLHWLTLPLFIWFMLVTPADVNAIGPAAFKLHSFLGLIFVTLALVWSLTHVRRGLVGRAGPKLGRRARWFHQTSHKALILGLFGVALTGFGLGVTATAQLWAGGLVPVGFPLNFPAANKIMGQVHTLEFYALAGLAAVHASFHIWRHFCLRDNALRIMFPRVLHRFL